MMDLDCSNASSSSFVHVNRESGFNSDLNGAMRGADVNANDTWCTSPNQLQMSVMFPVLESLGLLQWI